MARSGASAPLALQSRALPVLLYITAFNYLKGVTVRLPMKIKNAIIIYTNQFGMKLLNLKISLTKWYLLLLQQRT